MDNTYLTLKSLHILGVVLFLGNIIVTAVWKGMADRNGRPEVVGFAQRLVTLTDWIFTFGGAALILLAGTAMANHAGMSISGTPWIWHGYVIFLISGAIWVVILIPIQIAQARLAHDFEAGGDIPERYWRLNRIWFFWGIIATLIPLANLAVMVFK